MKIGEGGEDRHEEYSCFLPGDVSLFDRGEILAECHRVFNMFVYGIGRVVLFDDVDNQNQRRETAHAGEFAPHIEERGEAVVIESLLVALYEKVC